jgi:hypothetical protein
VQQQPRGGGLAGNASRGGVEPSMAVQGLGGANGDDGRFWQCFLSELSNADGANATASPQRSVILPQH